MPMKLKFATESGPIPVERPAKDHPDIKLKLLDGVLEGSWRHVDGRWLAVQVLLYHNGAPRSEGSVLNEQGFASALLSATTDFLRQYDDA